MGRIFSNVKRVWDLSTGLAHVHWIWTLLPGAVVTFVIKLLSETPLWVAIVAGTLISAIFIVLLHYFKNAHKMANPTRRQNLDAPMRSPPPAPSQELAQQLELAQLIADEKRAVSEREKLQCYRDKVAPLCEERIKSREFMQGDERAEFWQRQLISIEANLPMADPSGAVPLSKLLTLEDNAYLLHGPNSRGPKVYDPKEHPDNKARYQENCQRLRHWISALDRQLAEGEVRLRKLGSEIAARGKSNA